MDCQDKQWNADQIEDGTLDDRRRDGGTKPNLRIKEHGTQLILNEHNDDDDDDDFSDTKHKCYQFTWSLKFRQIPSHRWTVELIIFVMYNLSWKILWVESLWGNWKEKAEFTALTWHGSQVYYCVFRTWSKSLKNGGTGEKVEIADILEITFPYSDLC